MYLELMIYSNIALLVMLIKIKMNYLDLQEPIDILRGTQLILEHYSLARLRLTEQSVLHNMITLWNELPSNLKNSRSYNSFKFNYKKLLLSEY